MKALVVLVALGCLVTGSIAATHPAANDPPPQSLSFMTARDWRQAARVEKVALATDFMRVFCVRPTMSPARLTDCLDGRGPGTTPFDGALACIKELQETVE